MKTPKTLPTLDLHGRTVDEVADLVDRFITAQTKKGSDQVRIMTGKGSGKVKAATTAYLKLGGFPFEFERLNTGGRNEGVLVVFLD
ncbi:MAG: Smr/MutS family protein [Bdellovibrionota bacterium]